MIVGCSTCATGEQPAIRQANKQAAIKTVRGRRELRVIQGIYRLWLSTVGRWFICCRLLGMIIQLYPSQAEKYFLQDFAVEADQVGYQSDQ